MKQKPLTKSEAIRLTVEHFRRLRQLMQKQGRAWLQRAIDKEHKKVFGEDHE
jgi:predicted DNA-binding protein